MMSSQDFEKDALEPLSTLGHDLSLYRKNPKNSDTQKKLRLSAKNSNKVALP